MTRIIVKSTLALVLTLGTLVSWSQSGSSKSLVAPADVLQTQSASSQQFESLANMWENKVRADQSNANAWLNWFDAARFSHFQNKLKVRSEGEKMQLEAIVAQMAESIPESSQLHYARFLLNPFAQESFSDLETAYQSRTMGQQQLELDYISYLKLTGQQAELKKQLVGLKAKELFNSVEMEYNHNVLISVPKNGIVLTHGNSDTFPLLIWQEVEGLREDVKVVNIEWLQNENYRAELFSEFGVEPPSGELNNIYNWASAMVKNSGDRPLTFALTIPPTFLQQHQGQLHCTGLVFVIQDEYSPKELLKNWDDFKLDHFTDAKGLNANYQVPLYLLNQYFKQHGPERKLEDLEKYKAHFPELFKAGR